MHKFPKIHQFRGAVHEVQARSRFAGHDEAGAPILRPMSEVEAPTLVYAGTVKIHGTNAGLAMVDGVPRAQSRNRTLTLEDDNAGWAKYVESVPKEVWSRFVAEGETLYGEWCGQGIMKGTAVNQVAKRFVAFALRKADDTWATAEEVVTVHAAEFGIYNVELFPKFELSIDMSNPASAVPALKRLTDEVARQCPLGTALGVEGPGEGIVWAPVDPEWRGSRFWFKTKGEAHTERKRRTGIPVSPEVMSGVQEFVSETVVESRLEKAIDHLRSEGFADVSAKQTGLFLGWVAKDILAEEADVLEASGLEWKQVAKGVQKASKTWFFEWLNKEVFGE